MDFAPRAKRLCRKLRDFCFGRREEICAWAREVGDLDASAFLFAGGSPGTGGDPAVQGEQQSVSEPDGEDFYDDIFTDGRVAVGDSVTGNIDTSGDRDWFAVELEAGRTYRFDLKGSHTGDGTLSDPSLHGIYDEDGGFYRWRYRRARRCLLRGGLHALVIATARHQPG